MSVIAPFPHPRDRRPITSFDRLELKRIMNLYGRMVAAGHWRDYALGHHPEHAVFAAFRRHSERPEIRIEKRPALRMKQGLYALVGEQGMVLKRGHDLAGVMAPLERRLMRLVG
ncbi:MAG TPA: DUF2794 domain-containing protein [Sphingomicrobium sp.]|nr:DUF2794 domain-containing protein [Sphingomicrobium sp.]